MHDYRAAMAVRTPWGKASELRERKLNPGLGIPPAEVERNQRERLFGAMVATVAEKGYEATSVADLVALSGVSRRTFYERFQDKEDCFVATVETLLGSTVAAIVQSYDGSGPWEERAQLTFRSLMEAIATQPAAARLCLVEPYAAGPAALAPLARTVDEIERAGLNALMGLPGRAGTPPELARAVIGGLHAVVYQHLHRRQEQKLTEQTEELWAWAMSYEPPPGSLRALRRRTPAGGTTAPFAAHMLSERILRGFAAAVAERGLAATKIADIAERAQISQATFYAHFTNKADVLSAALDSSGAQIIAATLPAVRREGDCETRVRTAVASVFTFLAAEPDFARLRTVEAYVAGPQAIEQRNRTGEEIAEILLTLSPRPVPALTLEATLGAINTILFERVRNEGPESLPKAVPLATYIALAPSIGAQRAYAIATG